MKFKLDEESRVELRNFFEEAIVDVKGATQDFFDDMIEICQRERYLPLYKSMEKFLEFYHEDFCHTLKSLSEQWQNSDSSLEAFVRAVEASDERADDARAAALALQGDIDCIMQEHLYSFSPTIPEESTEVTLSQDLMLVFEDVQLAIKKKSEIVDATYSEYKDKIEVNSEENQVYINLGEILLPVLSAYQNMFEELSKNMRNLYDQLRSKGEQAEQTARSDAKEMIASAQNAGENLREISKMFQFE